jgi:hypothetical protein
MSDCCHAAGERKTRTAVRRVREMFAWALPSALLLLVPKCPACLAAYVTLWTGLGLSFVAAAWLRGTLLFLCGAILLGLVVVRLNRIRPMIPYFNRETEQCHTK